MSGLKLNLGCGRDHKKGYINIDALEPCDLKHDLRDPLPFEDGSVDEIITEGDTICLFSDTEWKGLKKEIVRVLRSSGKLEIECNDFEYVLKAFLDDLDGRRWDWWRMMIWGSQENEYDFCKNGFTYDKLVADLSVEGMADFIREKKEKGDKTGLLDEAYIHLVCYKQKRL